MSLSLVPSGVRPSVPKQMDAESPWGEVLLLALDAVSSPHTKRSYQAGLSSFFAWHRQEGFPEFERATVQRYRSHLEASSLSPSSINVYLSAIRKLAAEAAENGFLDREVAGGIVRIKGVTQHGVRAGNWLTPEETSALLRAPDPNVLKGLRDRAILALLVGCALRRTELARLRVEHIALRDARWVLVDLVGKGKRVRTVTVPAWTKMLVDDWTARAGISEGRVFRAVNKGGRMWGEQITDDVVWAITREYGAKIGKAHLAPHDLRRTCAKLCRASGGALEQIQFLLGHSSVQTTERYLGTRQNLAQAVNDNLPIEVPGSRADEPAQRTSDIPSKMPARSERGAPTLSIAVPDGVPHVRPERS
jgi:integrase/recombinase XerD